MTKRRTNSEIRSNGGVIGLDDTGTGRGEGAKVAMDATKSEGMYMDMSMDSADVGMDLVVAPGVAVDVGAALGVAAKRRAGQAMESKLPCVEYKFIMIS